MMSKDNLPVILVSARDLTAAAKVISDLIGKENPNVEKDGKNKLEYVWQLSNKYYTVEVRLVPVTDAHDDSEQLHFDEDHVEAHIIYFTENECATDEGAMRAAEARAGVVGGAGGGGRAEVRLALLAAAEAPRALRAWAARARYELVPLAGEAGEAGAAGEVGEEGAGGVERAREALHAHAWRGLARATDGSAGAREAVERAEGFAAALGALDAAAEGTRALSGAARLDAAEHLVAAFCRALGLDPDHDDDDDETDAAAAMQ